MKKTIYTLILAIVAITLNAASLRVTEKNGSITHYDASQVARVDFEGEFKIICSENYINIGEDVTLTAYLNGAQVDAQFSVDAESEDLITYSQSGSELSVTANENGIAKISATYDGNSANYSLVIGRSIQLSASELHLEQGKLGKLYLYDYNGNIVSSNWSVNSASDVVEIESDAQYCTVNATGVGEAIIETYFGDKKFECKVNVSAKIDYEEMVLVKAGSFQMGGDGQYDGKPIHTVTLSQDFYIGKYEVTQKLWQDVMGTNPSYFTTGSANKPVEQVSWYDCIEFCNALSDRDGYDKVYNIDKDNKDPNNTNESDDIKWTVTINENANGYRLPTEAQWEYAARGGQLSQSKIILGASDYSYSGSGNIDAVAWYSGNSSNTNIVGVKSSNELGIYDMSGNVWEWCFDWAEDYDSSAQADPVGALRGDRRVMRGGGYYGDDFYCCSAHRLDYDADGYGYYDGLRLVRIP